MEKWIKIADVRPDKNVNKTVVFAIPKEFTVAPEGLIKSSNGVIFYTWENLPSLDWAETVHGMWIETSDLVF